jgi:hypothetical protein
MLRHGCGYAQADAGHSAPGRCKLTSGQKNIQHTVLLHRAGAGALQEFLALGSRTARKRIRGLP